MQNGVSKAIAINKTSCFISSSQSMATVPPRAGERSAHDTLHIVYSQTGEWCLEPY